MTQKKQGWHRVTIEWHDGSITTTSSIEVTDEVDDGAGIAECIGATLEQALEQSGLAVLHLLAHAADSPYRIAEDAHPSISDAERRFADAAHRLVRAHR